MTRYREGYVVENKAMKELEKQGYYVVRSAKSLGVFDLLAFHRTRKPSIRFIQIKKTKSNKKYDKEINEIKEFNNYPENMVISKELWIWITREGWTKIIVGED